MVLSLGFILAFIGAAVALLIGILIFSEVSDAIICPAGAGGGFTIGGDITSYDNLGSLGTNGDALYFEGGSSSNFTVTTGKLNEAVLQNGTSDGGTQGEIRLGAGGNEAQWDFLHRANVGSNLTSINFWLKGDVDGNPDYPMLTNLDNGAAETDGIFIYTTLGAGVAPQDTCIRIEENNVGIHAGDSNFGCTMVEQHLQQ